MAKGKNQHVVPRDDGWGVKSEGNSKASKVFPTQGAAIQAGRAQARKNASELIIHGKDGRIREKNTYGKDPLPPKDKK